ncbi:MAG: hypothetical protein L6V82_04395 [Clostridiales bacterium]|nr:MAG: hypothetical protein L6V82_04395 [Clostridiales bacterium]
MKKKFVFIMMAIILVLSVAIGCAACNKKGELKLNNKMDAGEIMAALVNADIKSLTMVATERRKRGRQNHLRHPKRVLQNNRKRRRENPNRYGILRGRQILQSVKKRRNNNENGLFVGRQRNQYELG